MPKPKYCPFQQGEDYITCFEEACELWTDGMCSFRSQAESLKKLAGLADVAAGLLPKGEQP